MLTVFSLVGVAEEMPASGHPSMPTGSSVIQAVGSHIGSASRGQQSFAILQQHPVALGQHQLPVQAITQNGKHALPATSISPNAYGTSCRLPS